MSGPFRLPGHLAIPARTGSFIAGRPHVGPGPELPVVYPATGEVVSVLVEAGAEEVDAAVAAARAAFQRGPWPRMTVAARQEVLLAIHDAIRAESETLALLECVNTGLPLRELRARHLPRAAGNFRFFAEYIGQTHSRAVQQSAGYVSYVMREPVGVAALLAPWNAPLALASMKIAAAIAFGNCCVLKPSEQTPLALHRLMEILHAAGLPEGVVNLVNGRGAVTGQALVAHPDIDLISFTGGTETGRQIMAAAGRNLVPCTMELGGKSANIIFASADQERALDGALLGIYSNNGQQCLAGSRILLEESIADSFIERFIERSRAIRVGDPLDPATEIGPLASRAHMARVLSHAAPERLGGGRILTGGAARADLAPGFFIEPTAALAGSNAAPVAQEEIFGPFATFLTFRSAEEAFAIANDSRYGLVAHLWSDHHPTVMAATAALRAGVVWVNTPMMRELRLPFGGFRDSGVGREGGYSCEAFYTEEKTVTLPLVPPPLRRLGAQPPARGDETT